MPRTKLSSKGQVVIPKSLRDVLHWDTGVDLDVNLVKDVLTIRRAEPKRRLPTLEEVRAVSGILKYTGKTISIKEMDKAVGDMFRREWQGFKKVRRT